MSIERERRAGPARMPLSTIVEIGAGADGSVSFEAEAVDITVGGMRLSTAYVPEQDEPVVCRFEGLGGEEIIVQGVVAWRKEEAAIGEFGVRFTEIDQESLDALHELVGEVPAQEDELEQPDEDEEQPNLLPRGASVSLHVAEHAKPMKAVVHEASSGDILVSRRLDLLQVGRDVDLEDSASGERRPARIDRVSVQLDRETNIPSLLIALRYLDVAADAEIEESREPSADEERHTLVSEGQVAMAEDVEEEEEQAEASTGPAVAAWNKLKEAGPKFAALGAMAKNLGIKAKDVVTERVKGAKAANETEDEAEEDRPRRTTAPPPKGALRVDGKRDKSNSKAPTPKASSHSGEENETEERPPKKFPKKAVVAVLSVLLVTIVSLAIARKSGDGDEKQAKQQTSEQQQNELAAAPAASPGVQPMALAPATGAQPHPGSLVADVPLFGPTPMTTAQPAVAMNTQGVQPTAAMAGATPPQGDQPAANRGTVAAAAADDEALEGDDDEAAEEPAKVAKKSEDEAEDEQERPTRKKRHHSKRSSKKKHRRVASFGRGKLHDPVVYSLKMNREIRALEGSASSKGFTVIVKGARAKQGAARIRRLDRRVAKASIVNHGKNAKLTIRFKGKAPAFRVRASGSTLRIILSGGKRTARAHHHSKKRQRH